MKRFVVNGRPCSIVYTNSNWEMVPERDATHAIIRFDDGGIAHYVLNRL